MYALSIFGMLGGLLMPLLFIGLIVASIRAILLTVRVPRKASREPACEICGYHVSGSTLYVPRVRHRPARHRVITLFMEVRRRGSMLGASAAGSTS